MKDKSSQPQIIAQIDIVNILTKGWYIRHVAVFLGRLGQQKLYW